jgi:hypothetical protein
VAQKQYFAKEGADFAMPSVDFVSQMPIICDIPPKLTRNRHKNISSLAAGKGVMNGLGQSAVAFCFVNLAITVARQIPIANLQEN